MKHLEYVHLFLNELHELIPTPSEIRHNFTIDSGKLAISIYYKKQWNRVDMDKTYEDEATPKELAKGIYDLFSE